MGSIILCGLTLILDLASDVFLIGLAFGVFLVLRENHLPLRKWQAIFWLMMVFILLEAYATPAVYCLDLSFTIGNPDVSKIFGSTHSLNQGHLVGFGFGNLVGAFIQAHIARSIGRWIEQKIRLKLQ